MGMGWGILKYSPVDSVYPDGLTGLVPPVEQLVLAGVERERLHHVGACPQELSVHKDVNHYAVKQGVS